MDVNVFLRRCGKETFIKCYRDLKNNIDDDIICRKFLSEYTENAQQTRIANGKKIFRENLNIKALINVISSEKLSQDMIKIARTLKEEEEKVKIKFEDVISDSEAFHFMDNKGAIKKTNKGTQVSYNIPKEFFRYAVNMGILVNVGEDSSQKSPKEIYEISSEYKFKLGKGIIWMIGTEFDNENNKLYLLKASSNTKPQLIRSFYKEKKEEGAKWFPKLYEKNLSGNRLLVNIDEEKRILLLDIEFDIKEKKTSGIVVDNEYVEIESNISKIEGKAHNRIIFGAPGTGKSYGINEYIKENEQTLNYKRVTFHPSTSYSQFVGCYKPKLDRETGQITYKFVPGVFLSVLIEAINDKSKNHILIIEEINRANVSAVFGDIFQLLDRNSEGESEYEISTSEDIKDYLEHECENFNGDINTLKIPSNMYIWATMNSADQGVMPMDTAFKRRWNFEYIDINKGKDKIQDLYLNLSPYQPIKWDDLRKNINDVLTDININEDKLIGPFFLSKMEILSEEIDEIFKSKILMYLFQDVVKHNKNNFFANGIKTYSKLVQAYNEGASIFVEEISLKKKEINQNLEVVAEEQAIYGEE